jgi:hypothetical protein
LFGALSLETLWLHLLVESLFPYDLAGAAGTLSGILSSTMVLLGFVPSLEPLLSELPLLSLV